MWLRRQWIIGLIGLITVGVAWGQKAETAAADAAAEDTANATDVSTKPPLTGNPQIDYIYDPNLPHELRGYDLSDYPFYPRLPPDLLLPSFNFTCDDRLDGFYASVPHKCQVYHNCLFGQRYDFLCANYTVFDQKNFICHYASEVDCAHSADHYDRNEELYVTTTTSTTTPAPPQIIYVDRPAPPRRGQGNNNRPKRPRPFTGIRRPGHRRTTTTPAPDYYDDYYYDDYYQYYDDYYGDYANEKTTTTTTTTTQRPRRQNRPQRPRQGGDERRRPPGRFGNIFNAKDRKRPRVNPPVPTDEERPVERPRASRLQQAQGSRQQSVGNDPEDEPPQDLAAESSGGPRRRRPGGRKPRPGGRPPKKTTTTTTTTSTTEAVPEDDYYDYYDYAEESSTTAAPSRPSRPSFSRNRPGSSSRGQQNRSQPTTTTTTEAPTTEAPRGQVPRPSRVNIRKSPFSNRRTQAEGDVAQDDPKEDTIPQETGSRQQRPQRLRPQFPRRRSQNTANSEGQETEIIEEEPPLDPELEETTDGTPAEPAARQGGQIGSGRRRPGQRARGPQHRPSFDFYDY